MDDSPFKDTETPTAPQGGPVGPAVGIIIVVILLILGGFYFLVTQEMRLHQTPPGQEQLNS